MLSAGNINDMTTASSLLEQARGRFDRRGYDTNAFEAPLWNRRRCAPVPYDRHACKARNLVERL